MSADSQTCISKGFPGFSIWTKSRSWIQAKKESTQMRWLENLVLRSFSDSWGIKRAVLYHGSENKQESHFPQTTQFDTFYSSPKHQVVYSINYDPQQSKEFKKAIWINSLFTVSEQFYHFTTILQVKSSGSHRLWCVTITGFSKLLQSLESQGWHLCQWEVWDNAAQLPQKLLAVQTNIGNCSGIGLSTAALMGGTPCNDVWNADG